MPPCIDRLSSCSKLLWSWLQCSIPQTSVTASNHRRVVQPKSDSLARYPSRSSFGATSHGIDTVVATSRAGMSSSRTDNLVSQCVRRVAEHSCRERYRWLKLFAQASQRRCSRWSRGSRRRRAIVRRLPPASRRYVCAVFAWLVAATRGPRSIATKLFSVVAPELRVRRASPPPLSLSGDEGGSSATAASCGLWNCC